MTPYNEFQVQCTEHRILRNIYTAQRKPRTAQIFLRRGSDGNSIDVINVHAPSGKPSLTDAQRKTLLRNLLQSNSESSPGHTIGTARFVICGDMNTAPHSLSQMLQRLRQQGVLQTQAHVMEGTMPTHGDVCFVGSIVTQNVNTTANNHDPQHDPYGIQWISSQAAPAWAQCPSSSFGSPRSRLELQNTNLPEHGYVTEQLPMTFRVSVTEQTQPEETKKKLPAKELQQTALADAGFEKDDARMPASGSATEQTLPEEKANHCAMELSCTVPAPRGCKRSLTK